MQIKELGELAFIKKLAQQFSAGHPRIIKGIGDDTSVTIQDRTRYLLCTTDTLVEDIHFSLKYTSAYNLGKKAVSISLSDIAAMGGIPVFLLTSITIPKKTTTNFIELLYKGIKKMAQGFDVALIGGNTSSSPDKITITTTIVGEVPKDEAVFRKGASVGDMIYVTGCLGDSALGLKLLKKSAVRSQKLIGSVLRHIDPLPRVKEGREIAKRKLATGMIDISDGLVADLRHIAEQSSVGARIWLDKIPLSASFKKWALTHPNDIALALNGGEDYELLFTASEKNASKMRNLSKELSLPITHIGEIMPKRYGIKVLDQKGKAFPLSIEGFEHFRNTSL